LNFQLHASVSIIMSLYYRKVDELSNLADGLREERDVASRKAEEVQALYDELEKKIAPFKVLRLSNC